MSVFLKYRLLRMIFSVLLLKVSRNVEVFFLFFYYYVLLAPVQLHHPFQTKAGDFTVKYYDNILIHAVTNTL